MNCSKACEGCALTPGAAANLEPHNQLRALLAVLGPFPFYCHESLDWQSPIAGVIPQKWRKKLGEPMRVCGGWVREVRALAATGYYRGDSTRDTALDAYRALARFLTEGISEEEKADAAAELQEMIEILQAKRETCEAPRFDITPSARLGSNEGGPPMPITWFKDSPDAGDPACVCSLCGETIAAPADDSELDDLDDHAGDLATFPVRMWKDVDGETLEARFHPEPCFPVAIQELEADGFRRRIDHSRSQTVSLAGVSVTLAPLVFDDEDPDA